MIHLSKHQILLIWDVPEIITWPYYIKKLFDNQNYAQNPKWFLNYFLSKVRDFKKLSRPWLDHWANIQVFDHDIIIMWSGLNMITCSRIPGRPFQRSVYHYLVHLSLNWLNNGILEHVTIFNPGHMITISWSNTWGKYCIRA